MTRVRVTVFGCLILFAALVVGQNISPQEYVCPMHPDAHAAGPGACPRCGMALVPAIPDFVEYPVRLTLAPRTARAGDRVALNFRVENPKSRAPVTSFQMTHEKLFHMFIVSRDLEFFVHDHPAIQRNGSFRYEGRFPQSGMYRLLTDFYPTGGTPQLSVQTMFLGGGSFEPVRLAPDLASKRSVNLEVELAMDPPQPVAGFKTLMFFRVKPADGLEPYLGAWGHMLAASDDLIDLIHQHPFLSDGGFQIQFNMIFPRARTYRIWVQFQRMGIVNTAVFTVPVSVLR